MAKLRRSDITQNTILTAMGATHRQNERQLALKGNVIKLRGKSRRDDMIIEN